MYGVSLVNVVVVDEHRPNHALYAKVLSNIEDVQAFAFVDPHAALAWLRNADASLLIVDQVMTKMTGIEFVGLVRALPNRGSLPFLMISAVEDKPLRREAFAAGALALLSKPIDPMELLHLAGNIVHADKQRRDSRADAGAANERALGAARTLEIQDGRVLDSLLRAMRLRDPNLGVHADNVSALTGRIALKIGLPELEARVVERAALLHDVGKMCFSDRILLGTAPLTPAERQTARAHVATSASILAGVQSALLQTALAISISHHERWDGDGYPDGLRGDQIPLAGRIVAVADAYCAMTANRPQRLALSPGHALRTIVSGRATVFDPLIVSALEELLKVGLLDAASRA